MSQNRDVIAEREVLANFAKTRRVIAGVRHNMYRKGLLGELIELHDEDWFQKQWLKRIKDSRPRVSC